MNIQYIEPLHGGWSRMKQALFQPFDIGKWFILGFTAFLASLLDGGGGAGGNSDMGKRTEDDLEDLFNFPGIAWEWLNSHPIWFTLIIVGIVFLFVVAVIFTWLSSRGKFMFLDNVAHNQAEVKKPWYEYKREGNSLFLWRLIYGLIILAVVIVLLVNAFVSIRNLYFEHVSLSDKVLTILGIVLYFLILFIVTGYISLFLDDFVVPIMYKHRISTSRAWYKFLELLFRYPGYFLLYGLFVFVLIIIVVIAVIIFGFASCCIGFLLLIMPYIGSVVFLPVSYTFRAFSLEFLQQFGEEYTVFPQKAGNNNDLSIENTKGQAPMV